MPGWRNAKSCFGKTIRSGSVPHRRGTRRDRVLGYQLLDQRSKRIRESLEAAQKARDEAARSQEEMQRQIETSRTEGQQLIAQARDVADRFRQEEIAKAREEIGVERARAQSNIQRERDAAIEELRREFAGMTITAAERVIERSIDEQTHRELIEKVLEEGSQVMRN